MLFIKSNWNKRQLNFIVWIFLFLCTFWFATHHNCYWWWCGDNFPTFQNVRCSYRMLMVFFLQNFMETWDTATVSRQSNIVKSLHFYSAINQRRINQKYAVQVLLDSSVSMSTSKMTNLQLPTAAHCAVIYNLKLWTVQCRMSWHKVLLSQKKEKNEFNRKFSPITLQTKCSPIKKRINCSTENLFLTSPPLSFNLCAPRTRENSFPQEFTFIASTFLINSSVTYLTL